MKRMYAPSHWCLDKLKGVYATRPSAGPHKLRECIPLTVLLQNRLKYALSGQDAIKICRNRDGNIKIDNKIRRDPRFPLGFMDVVQIPKTGENFRILYDIIALLSLLMTSSCSAISSWRTLMVWSRLPFSVSTLVMASSTSSMSFLTAPMLPE